MFADFRVHGLNKMAKPSFFFFCKSVWTGGESIGKISCSTHVRENANMGHPSREKGLVASRESEGRI